MQLPSLIIAIRLDLRRGCSWECVCQAGSADHQEIDQQLTAAGYDSVDLSHDEVAKLHVRHLIGGARQHLQEQVYRVEFPERPGAWALFLDELGDRFDISLFHYRNHGADYGRVLIAFAG